MKKSSLYLSLILVLTASLPLQANTDAVSVLVWDEYFSPTSWNEKIFGPSPRWGSEFAWIDVARPFKPHGLQVATVIGSHNSEVILHRAYHPALPWQDPEICDLTEDRRFAQAVAQAGHQPLENCREKTMSGIRRFSDFIHREKIRIVNISHGVYFDNYVRRNPDLLAKMFPNVKMDDIHRFLYQNYLQLMTLAKSIFAENPETVFVLAAGNNDDEVDRDIPMKWEEDPPRWYPVPTLYASATSSFPNVISVASSYDGKKIAPGSNTGKKNVALAKQITGFAVPDGHGSSISFGGTSAAAAELTRDLAILMSGPLKNRSAADIKSLVLATIRPAADLNGKVATGGFYSRENLLAQLNRRELKTRQTADVIEVDTKILNAHYTTYELPTEFNPRNYGCHSLLSAPDGRLWMTMPWANVIQSFDPKSDKFTQYHLPTPESRPDGISIDADGNLWYGTDPNGGLGRLNPKTGEMTDFPHPKLSTLNITAVDSKGWIWASGHRAQVISAFDPVARVFHDWRVKMDWPLDMRVDEDDVAWVTGLKGFNKPWGQGALIEVHRDATEPIYHPLPERSERLQAYFVAPSGSSVLVTLSRDGYLLFDKRTKTMRQYSRRDRKQLYNMARTAPDGSIFIGNAHEKFKSFDVIDPHTGQMKGSYYLPDQVGEPREAMTFDKDGNFWYCQKFTNKLVKMVFQP